MKISIITTCKGRLTHLKECLPSWLQQSVKCEIVVVDYACPENAADYCDSLDKGIVTVRPENLGQFFNLSHARNLGALAASGDVFMFIDADTTLSVDFIKYHKKLLKENTFLTGWFYGDATGSCIVWRKDFYAVRGYNENVDGWGFDDIDFYKRLEAKGITQLGFHHGITTIKHDDYERVKHYHRKDMRATDRENQRRTKRKLISCIQ